MWGPRLVPWAITLTPVVVIGVIFWPGHLNADILEMAIQADRGYATNFHAGLLVAAWGLVWPLGVGPGWLFVGQLTCVCVGSYMVLRAVFAPLPAALITAIGAFTPVMFGALALVGRDTWMLGFLMLAFGFLVRAAQSNWPARGWWLAGSTCWAWLALASRQNAVAAVVVVSIAVAALVGGRLRRARRGRLAALRRNASIGVAGIAITALLVLSQSGLSSAVNVINVHPEQYTFIQDLGFLSRKEHRDLFPASVVRPQNYPVFEERFAVDFGASSVGWYAGAPITLPLNASQSAALRHRWVDEVTDDPLEYLGVRGDLFLRQIGITRPGHTVYHAQIDPNPLGYRTRFPGLDHAGSSYVRAFVGPNDDGDVIYRVWIYLLVDAIAAVVLLRSWRPTALKVVGALAASALTLQIGLFFLAPSVRFRFEEAAVWIAILSGAALVKLAIAKLRPVRARTGA